MHIDTIDNMSVHMLIDVHVTLESISARCVHEGRYVDRHGCRQEVCRGGPHVWDCHEGKHGCRHIVDGVCGLVDGVGGLVDGHVNQDIDIGEVLP